MVASNAKLALLTAPSHKTPSNTKGMESYIDKGRRPKEISLSPILNPHAKEYQPTPVDSQQPLMQQEQQHAYKNAKQDGSQLNETLKHEKASSKPFLDPHMQLTNPNAIQSQLPILGNNKISALCSLLQRLNEITTLFIQQTSHLLPPREIPYFNGDHLLYRTFIRAFEHCVESNTSNDGYCLYFWDKYTSVQPRELVRCCQHMAPDKGYAMAKDLIKEHFGNEHKITAAYMEKALSWPVVKPEDVKSLQAYALFLHQCCNVMEDIQYNTWENQICQQTREP